MHTNVAEKETIDSIADGFGEMIERQSEDAEKNHILPKSPIPKQDEIDFILSEESLISSRILEHLDEWFIQESSAVSRNLGRSNNTQEKLGVIKGYSLRQASGLNEFLEWVEKLPIDPELQHTVKHETCLKYSVFYALNRDVKKAVTGSDHSYGSGEGSSRVFSLLAMEMLLKTDSEDGKPVYVRDPFDFWENMERIIPKSSVFQQEYSKFRNGSLAEVLTGRAIGSILDDFEGLELTVSPSRSDAINGYDLAILKNGEIFLPIDVKSWGYPAIISRKLGKYEVNGIPQEVDPETWQIPRSLIKYADRYNIDFISARVDISHITSDIDEWERFKNSIKNVLGGYYEES